MQTIIRQASIADKGALWDSIKIAYGDLAQHMIPDRWNWQYLDNPFLDKNAKELPIWIAIKGDRIAGQICAIAVEIKVGDEIHHAVWGVDLIVLPTYRRQGIGRRLIEAIIEHYGFYMALWMSPATRRIYHRLGGCIDIEPVPVYRRLVKLNRDSVFRYLMTRTRRQPRLNRIARIGCHVFLFDRIFPLAANTILGFRDIVERRTKRECRTQIVEVKRFGDEIDQLWSVTNHQFEVIVKRDQRFLNWRFTANTQLNYRSFIATRDGETKGYIVLRKPEPIEPNVGIIVDLYTSRDDEETLEDLIRHAIHFFGQEVAAITCATTLREYQKALSKLGFLDMDFLHREKTFPICFCTNSTLRTRLDELKNSWFLTKADSDWDQLWPA